MPKPDVSVVTVSFGRAPLVLRKLEALARQTVGAERLEVILVDNACPAAVGSLVGERAWPFALRVLPLAQRTDAGRARALAAEHARGRWLWWSDDDVVPDDDALAHHLQCQAHTPGVSIGSVRFVHQRQTTRLALRRASVAHFTGVNTLFERAAWLRVKDSLPVLPRPYGGEDTVVGCALWSLGVPFVAVTASWVSHQGPLPSQSADPVRAYDAGFNAQVVAAHYPWAAWSLGVHRRQLRLKRLLNAPLSAALLGVLAPRTMTFERGYLQGALAARTG